jgi:hypothetical protein
MDPKVPLLSRPNMKVYVLGTTDGADPVELRHVVEKDVEDKDALHALSPFSYMEAMDLSADNQIRILEARHGGLSFKTIGKGLSGKRTAKDVLSAKGWAKLEKLAATKFRHNGSSFKRHKQRMRQPKGEKLKSYKRKPGDSLCTDSYPTRMASTPTFQVINDPEINKLKSDLKFHLQDHFVVFGMPFVVSGDFSKEMHLGENQMMTRGQAVQLRSSTPHHQWQHGGERYIFRVINITTCLKLDSQLPESLTINLAQHASLLLMVSPVEHKGLWTAGWEVCFQTECNYCMLKRAGCLVYCRLEKEERKNFGTHGALAVLIGLNGFKMPDFTHALYKLHSKQVLYRRDVLFAEEHMPCREGRKTVSPDIQLHPATCQCTGMCLHSGALLQRQRNALLSVPSASTKKYTI